MTILSCGHEPSPHSEFTTGYGVNENSETFCYSCCAENDREYMKEHGKITLYLTINREIVCNVGRKWFDGKVGNWPDSLSFPCRVKQGNHNIAGTRYDVWFNGPNGRVWHGVQYGDMTQLCYCKQTKEKWA